jgi:glycosyltransferase involved in cell wall biosynthesis
VNNCISYIVPTYNGQNYIRKTIDSIHNGNFEDGDEIIIIDDCSNDKTRNIVKELLENKEIDRLVLLEKNIGEGLAKNTAIKKIKNKYFFCLDQDNILAPNSITPLRKLIDKYDAVTFGEIRYFQFSTLLVSHKHFFDTGIISLGNFQRNLINPGFSGNLLYSKKAWEAAGEFENVVLESWNLMYKMILKNMSIMTIPKSYYFHRFGHESAYVSATRNFNENELLKKAIPISANQDVDLIYSKSQIKYNTFVFYLVRSIRKILNVII